MKLKRNKKRFVFEDVGFVWDNNELLDMNDIVQLLNELYEKNEYLEKKVIGLVENGLKELFGERYRLIEDISDKEINDEQDNQINKSIKTLVKENNQLQKELFESEYENICEQYYSNPIHKDEAIKNLKIDFKKRFGRTFELEY